MPTTPLGVWYPGPNDTFPPGFSGAEGGTGWLEQLAESVDSAIEDYVDAGRWELIDASATTAARTLTVPEEDRGRYEVYELKIESARTSSYPSYVGFRANGESSSATTMRYNVGELGSSGVSNFVARDGAAAAAVACIGSLASALTVVRIVVTKDAPGASALSWIAETFRNTPTGGATGFASGRWNPPGTPNLASLFVGHVTGGSSPTDSLQSFPGTVLTELRGRLFSA